MNSRFRKPLLWATILLTIAIAIQPSVALAYVGPAAGMNFLSAAVGFLIAVFSAIGIILFWPIRVLLKRIGLLKAKAVRQEDSDAEIG